MACSSTCWAALGFIQIRDAIWLPGMFSCRGGWFAAPTVVMAGRGRRAASTPAPEHPGVTNGSNDTRMCPAHARDTREESTALELQEDARD